PAIDLRSGRVVRLKRGDTDRETRYSEDPASVADRFITAGARWLHVIDLDGAVQGVGSPNETALGEILERGVLVQVGGGLRDLERIEAVLEKGVARVLLGTLAIEQPERVAEAVRRWGAEKISVALDANKGSLVSRGWTRLTDLNPVPWATRLQKQGIRTVLVTDVQRDGMGSGINIKYARQISEQCGLNVIIAGGARSLVDVRAAQAANLAGIVLGRALYEGQIKLEQALEC
ncbi:MAG: 1-(5-phosphoribosyl)-5-[(5-phosphoribosylamino)methylideneamino]imidazole-4-carboxamide isomerase, partial [Anaerolineales bacterium]